MVVVMADAMMAMAGWVSLGDHHGPVNVTAAVPVLRCGVVSDEVAGLGVFHVLTLWVLYYPGSLSPKQPFTSHLDGEEVSACHVSL
jgi:hypothetical protein